MLLYFFSPRPFICICLSLWNNKLYLNDWMSISFVIWEQSPGLLSVWPLNNSLSSAEHILFALQRARAKILSFPLVRISPPDPRLARVWSVWHPIGQWWPRADPIVPDSWFQVPDVPDHSSWVQRWEPEMAISPLSLGWPVLKHFLMEPSDE